MKLCIRILILGLLCGLLAGCGGSSHQLTGASRGGRASFTIRWPDRSRSSRVIPLTSQSIKVSILQNGNVYTSQLVARPTTGNTTTVSFTDLPLGALTATATAYPNADGTGTAQAAGSVPLNIQAGQTTSVTLSMDSTIVSVALSLSTLNLALNQGTIQSASITATARDADGNIVLISPQELGWASDAPGVATVYAVQDTIGRVTAAGIGTAHVTASVTVDNAGTKVTSSPLTVNVLGGGVKRIYVADAGFNRITALDFDHVYRHEYSIGMALKLDLEINGRPFLPPDPRFEKNFGVFGSDVGQFNGPAAIAVGDDNRIYVVDRFNYRIVRIDDMNGTNWVSYGTRGNGQGQFSDPTGIWVDHNNRIYVADRGANRIVRMDDMTGAGWITYGSQGDGINQFNHPNSVMVGNDSRIYIADQDNNRIVRVDDMQGTNWTVSDAGLGLRHPSKAFLTPDGRIAIADRDNSRIVRTTALNNGLVDTITKTNPSTPYSAPPTDGFAGTLDLFVDETNLIYVVDYNFAGIHRVVAMVTDNENENHWAYYSAYSGPQGVFVKTSP
ncbi:MAG TPA: NHL repeat-containing protein [Chthonomonadaceae bacterium]|nr:NHL repeat-containing protein [Chthonomonadaceae bacterium]